MVNHPYCNSYTHTPQIDHTLQMMQAHQQRTRGGRHDRPTLRSLALALRGARFEANLGQLWISPSSAEATSKGARSSSLPTTIPPLPPNPICLERSWTHCSGLRTWRWLHRLRSEPHRASRSELHLPGDRDPILLRETSVCVSEVASAEPAGSTCLEESAEGGFRIEFEHLLATLSNFVSTLAHNLKCFDHSSRRSSAPVAVCEQLPPTTFEIARLAWGCFQDLPNNNVPATGGLPVGRPTSL